MKILITGAEGLLGSNLCTMWADSHEVYATSREKPSLKNCICLKLDITKREEFKKIKDIEFDLIINCAALTNLDYCEEHPEECEKVNALGAKNVAIFSRENNSYFVHVSTDSLFDGTRGDYAEEDETRPINVYSRSKLNAEKCVEAEAGDYVIIRTTIYGWNKRDKFSLAEWMLDKLRRGEELPAFEDISFSPILVNNLGGIMLNLFYLRYHGLINIGCSKGCSKFDFAKKLAEVFGLDPSLIKRDTSTSVTFKAERAKILTLDTSRAKKLFPKKLLGLEEGLKQFKELEEKGFVKKLKEDRFLKTQFSGKSMEITMGDKKIGEEYPTYFIADIAANHDGDLERAKQLIKLAFESGADAVKFQHHRVQHYVSKKGFETLGSKMSHQSKWKKSVFQVYKDAEVPLEWTSELKKFADNLGIHLFTTPYDLGMVDLIGPHVLAFKIGSGDINWPDMHLKVAEKGKPVFISTGASTLGEVQKAVEAITSLNKNLVLIQCNTNYTANDENFDYINLNVLKTYRQMYPDIILGLSDHTKGHATVLGAVALGARVIEKHFTDDITREGPDHPFSMDPKTWREMVDRTRELERALGSTIRKVEDNEKETVVLQRRCIRAGREIKKGKKITIEDIEFQRPAPRGSLEPSFKEMVLGKRARRKIFKEEQITFAKIG